MHISGYVMHLSTLCVSLGTLCIFLVLYAYLWVLYIYLWVFMHISGSLWCKEKEVRRRQTRLYDKATYLDIVPYPGIQANTDLNILHKNRCVLYFKIVIANCIFNPRLNCTELTGKSWQKNEESQSTLCMIKIK